LIVIGKIHMGKSRTKIKTTFLEWGDLRIELHICPDIIHLRLVKKIKKCF
jgi:hypothetical protein